MRSALDSLLSEKAAVMDETGVSNFEVDNRELQNLYNNLANRRYSDLAALNSRRSTLTSLRQAISDDPDYIPVGTSSNNLTGIRLALDNEILELNDLSGRHPVGSPPVQRQEELVEKLKEQARATVRDYMQFLGIEVKSYESSIWTIENQMEEVKVKLDMVPVAFHDLTLINAQITVTSKALTELQRRLSDVRINSMGGEKTNRLMRMTAPEIIQVVSGSRRIVYLVMIAFLGLVLAIVVAFVIDRSDHTIHDVKSMRSVIDAPPLGAVSKAGK